MDDYIIWTDGVFIMVDLDLRCCMSNFIRSIDAFKTRRETDSNHGKTCKCVNSQDLRIDKTCELTQTVSILCGFPTQLNVSRTCLRSVKLTDAKARQKASSYCKININTSKNRQQQPPKRSQFLKSFKDISLRRLYIYHHR